jgi:hypothetical protein
MILRTAFVAAAVMIATPASADRFITGAEAQRALAGKAFRLHCIDGTHGRGFFHTKGVVTVSYKRPAANEDAAETLDRAVVRANGDQICLAWKEFNGGGNSCYPVLMKSATQFRLGASNRWCDISAN